MALFLTQNLFVASGIDYLIYLTRPSHLSHRLLDRVGDRNSFPAVINAEMRESTRQQLALPTAASEPIVREGDNRFSRKCAP